MARFVTFRGQAPSTRRRLFSLFLALTAMTIASGLAGCGGGTVHKTSPRRSQSSTRAQAPRHPARHLAPAPPEVLVTAPSENKLLVVRLPSGRVMRQLEVSGEPQYAAEAGLLVVVSASSRTVSLINPESLRLVKRFHGFAAPHIVAVSPDGEYAYITDNATGRVTAIGLYDQKVVSSLIVGQSAHHLAFSPNARQVWIALGESAPSVAVLSSALRQPGLPGSSPALDYARPHLAGQFHPGFLAHDLQFSPDSKQVWITSADTDDVGVFGARSHRLLFRVPAGAPPQHVAIAGRYAYLTSGYGSRIEQVGLSTGRVIRRAWVPYGTFELATVGRYVVAVSLLRGTLAICTRGLRLLRVVHLAPSLEDVIPYSR